MITLKVVVNRETMKEAGETIGLPYVSYKKEVNILFYNTESTGFIAKRDAQKIVNDYAVTKLPFVLLVNDDLPEDQQEYAAVYSEIGPITVERINEKL